MYNQMIQKVMAGMVVLIVTFAGVAPAFSGARIIPTGSVKVYKEQKLVQILKKESALPDDVLLTTQGKCGVRSQDLYLVASDGSTFGIEEGLNGKNIRVNNGIMYYAVTQRTGNLAFITPAGIISVMQILFNADANGGLVKGYLDVSGSQVQLGVLEGGSMVVKTAMGDKQIQAGKQIILGIADPIKKEDKEGEGAKAEKETPSPEVTEGGGGVSAATGTGATSGIPAAYLAGGAVLAAGAAVYGIANATSDDDTTTPASPVTP